MTSWHERRLIGATILRAMKDAESSAIRRAYPARKWLVTTGVWNITFLRIPNGSRYLRAWVNNLPPLNVVSRA